MTASGSLTCCTTNSRTRLRTNISLLQELVMSKKKAFFVLLLGAILVLGTTVTLAQEPVTLRILTHWGEENLLAAQDELYSACETQTGVNVELETVPFNDLLTKIVTGHTAGTDPDIIHLYNLWLPDFAQSGLLAMPSAEVVDA